MGSHTLDIIRQGIVPSITGGWYYDPNQSTFSNIFHLYLWLFLLALPLTLYLTVATSIFVWMVYCGVVGVVFASVKAINYKLHHMFDTSEVFEEALDKLAEKNASQSKVGSRRSSAKSENKNGGNSDKEEYIEMSVMNHMQNTALTPPVHHSSRNSIAIEKQTSKDQDSSQPDIDDSKNDADDRSGPSTLLPQMEGLMLQMVEVHKTTLAATEVTTTPAMVAYTGFSPLPASQCTSSPSSAASSSSSASSSPTLSSSSSRSDSRRRASPTASATTNNKNNDMDNAQTLTEDDVPVDITAITVTTPATPTSPTTPTTPPTAINIIVTPTTDPNSMIINMSPDQTPADADEDENISAASAAVGEEPSSSSSSSSPTAAAATSDVATAAMEAAASPKVDVDLEAAMTGSNSPSAVTSPVEGMLALPSTLSNADDESSTNIPNKITTKVYVEKQLSKSSSLSNTTPDCCHRADADTELSPEPKIKRRKAVRRTKSSLESWYGQAISAGSTPGSQSHHQLQRSLDCALASRQRPRLLPLDTKDGSCLVTFGRSHSNSLERDNPKRLRRQAHVDSGGADSDETNTDDSIFRYQTLTPSNRSLDAKIKRWLNGKKSPASSSTDKKTLYRADHKLRSSQRTSFPPARGHRYPISLHIPQSASCKGALDVSVGDIFTGLKDIRNNKRTFSGALSNGQRMISGQAVVETTQASIGASASAPSAVKNRDSGMFRFMRLLHNSDEKKTEPMQSQQSSVVGLDWLFSTDSESLSSDEGPFNASPDPPDPETLRRNIIEILDDNNEFPEKMRKLKAVVQPTKRSYSRNDDQSKDGRLKEPTVMKDKATSPAELGGAVGGVPLPEDGDTRSTDSKSLTPTEVSALLPAREYFYKDDQKARRRYRREHGRVAARRAPRRNSPPLTALSNMIVGSGGHLASSHDDTTEGAMHYFQDELGNWFTYTFGENSSGVAQGVLDTEEKWIDMMKSTDKGFRESSSSSGSGSPVIIDPSPKVDERPSTFRPTSLDFETNIRTAQTFYPWQINQMGQLWTSQSGLVESYAMPSTGDLSDSPSVTEASSYHRSPDKPKQFYKFWLFPNKYVKIHFDRLALLALLDRNLTISENLVAVIMAVAVSSLGALILSSHFYQDLYIFLFCFILASCQYSLLKSVQPDAASPMHGYNRLIVFSRPFYFCLCCGLLKLLDYATHNVSSTAFIIYGFPFTASASLKFATEIMKVFILLFPVLFTVGLLPQVKTFIMYILEQTDMHIFGGNATTSLAAAVYSVTRSVIAVALLYFFCYYAMQQKENSQHVMFSIYCALLVAISYHLSRSASDPTVLLSLIKDLICGKSSNQPEEPGENELIDPLPDKLKKCVSDRLQSDLLVCILFAIIMFAVHVSTVFSSPVLQPYLSDVLCYLAVAVGFIIHYIIPQLRKEMPWLCCYDPILPSYKEKHLEADEPAPVMCFEKLYIWLRFVERNIIYPVVFLCALTLSAPTIVKKFGLHFGSVIVVVCGLKLLRFSFSDTLKQHMILAFTVLFFKYDYKAATETFLLDFFIMSIIFCKFCDLLLKLKFIFTYIAPWQITWGSAFHAFAQPFSVPHSAMLFVQAAVSAIFSTPLNPFLGSAIFITSYVRPVKFWERDYNTKRVDHSNTCLASQLDRNPGADDNNLNSIFYEHLTRSLQHSLCGDVMLGRWGNYCQGDCFIMASDYLNALVHIIETGNGLLTFQLRGLEFRGTYCQQREVEAITEEVDNDEGFCCCELGHLPHFLSLNAAFNQRWLAWEVVVTNYILQGYSITDNSAATMLQVFDLRKLLINYYIKSIIYYTVRSPRLDQWTQNEELLAALAPLKIKDYVDLDPTFNSHVDDDYDTRLLGITRNSFCNVYFNWIQFCAARREKSVESGRDSFLVSLCYGLSLLGRRALGTASHNSASASVDYFLFGLHALFKGDFRVTSSRDEWVVKDIELLRRVVAPALRMSLKLHQDHFASDEYDDLQVLYNAISNYEKNMVISHEADPAWRNAVLSNTDSLLALRHVFDEGSDEYKIIMLNKRYLSFRVVKVNRECVRGLWAGQQQELIFLRNRNPERGSIQNAKQALRNMINSSCDQPIGYPIYVSPLTTSYSSTHEQLAAIIGGEFVLANVKGFFKNMWTRMRRHCGASCAGGSSGFQEETAYSSTCTHAAAATQLGTMCSNANAAAGSAPVNPSDITLQNLANRGSLVSSASSAASKPATTTSITGLFDRSGSGGVGGAGVGGGGGGVGGSVGSNNSTAAVANNKDTTVLQRVRIMDPSQTYENVNLGRRIDVQWPREDWKENGGKSGWNGWIPTKGMEGTILHRWVPCHRDPLHRSHVDRTILLVQIGTDKYVPIAETGVLHLGAEV